MKRIRGAIAIAAACAAAHGAFAAQPADELALTRRLAEAGAPQLVLDRVLRLQPRERTAPAWGDWEALHCTALAALARHAQLAERVAALPSGVRSDALSVCYTAGARAALALSRYGEARRHAAQALWRSNPAPADVQALRLLVIDAYVAERRGEEAYRAMLRYQQDHPPLPRDVLGRFVGALLDLKMDREALTWLAQLDDAQPAKLRLRVRAGLVPREAAIVQARAALAKGGDAAYWNVILDAAAEGDALPLRIAAHEQLLNRRDHGPDTPSAAHRLWDAYLAAAVGVANGARLLVGDDASWADHAGRRLATDPAVGRALFAHLAQRAQTAASRHNAQLHLLHAYESERLQLAGLRVFNAVFGDVDALDTQVRYRLGGMAEAHGQPAAAVRYWQDLPVPPDMEAGEWLLRTSRQRWRAGAQDAGIESLVRHYAGPQPVSAGTMRQGAAYAEELAERGQPGPARRLIEALLPHAPAAQSRDLLFTLGRVREQAGELPLAAEAYLRSALAAPGAPDAAAVQARLRAGAALARAGYVRDARTQLEWVLNNTKDAALAEAARGELRKLQL